MLWTGKRRSGWGCTGDEIHLGMDNMSDTMVDLYGMVCSNCERPT